MNCNWLVDLGRDAPYESRGEMARFINKVTRKNTSNPALRRIILMLILLRNRIC